MFGIEMHHSKKYGGFLHIGALFSCSWMKGCGYRLELFNILFTLQKRKSWIEYEFRIFLGKNYIFEINGEGEFNIKDFFSIEAKVRRTRVKASFVFLGYYNLIRFGRRVRDFYDYHADKYYEWDDEEDKCYIDEKEYFPKEPRKEVYKEFFISKLVKIYNKDWLNCFYGRAFEFALPFFHYLKIDFKKPFCDREWLGFRFIINFENGLLFKVTLMFLKYELRFILAKNKLNRESNISSVSSVKRLLQLYKRPAKLPEKYFSYIALMIEKRKSAPFIYMLNNSSFMLQDLKSILTDNDFDFEDICPDHNFCRPIFESICNRIIELDVPIDTWEYLTEDNNYLESSAKEQLFAVRNEYISNKRKKYNFELEEATDFECDNGYSIVTYLDSLKTKQYVIDNDNIRTDLPEEISVCYVTKNNKIIGRLRDDNITDKPYVLADLDGKIILNYDYVGIIDYGTPNSSEQFFQIQKGNKYGLAEDNGNILIIPQYKKLIEAGNGLLIAQNLKHKYGIVDVNGKIIIPFKYSQINTIGTKYFTAKIKGKWGLYDYDNNIIISPQYQAFDFYDKFGVAKLNNKWGMIDVNNECLTGFIFDKADVNSDEIPWFPVGNFIKESEHKDVQLDVNVRKNRKWGVYSLITGKQVLPMEYDEVGNFYNNICKVIKYETNGKSEDLVDRNNNNLTGSHLDNKENYYFSSHPVDGMWMCKFSGKYEFRSVKKINDSSDKSFEAVGQYNEEVVAVSLHRHWGFMDKDENIIIPIIFDSAGKFHNGKAFVSINGKSGFIDKNGNEINFVSKG